MFGRKLKKQEKASNVVAKPSQRDQTLAAVKELLSEKYTIFDNLRALEAEKKITAPEPDDLLHLEGQLYECPPRKPKSLLNPPPWLAPSARALKKTGFSALHWGSQLFIISFVLAWIFLLGVMVGRGSLRQTDLGDRLAGWVENFSPPLIPEPEIIINPATSQNNHEPQTNLDLTGHQAPIQENEPLDLAANGSPTEGRPVQLASSEPEHSDQSGEKTPEDLVAVTPPSEAENFFTVQTAYTSSEREAKSKTNRLVQQGYSAYCYKNNKNYYPVRVGRYKTYKEAESELSKLKSNGYRDAYISRVNRP